MSRQRYNVTAMTVGILYLSLYPLYPCLNPKTFGSMILNSKYMSNVKKFISDIVSARYGNLLKIMHVLRTS